MSFLLIALGHEFRRHHALANKGLPQLEGTLFFARPVPHVNSGAIVVKHLSRSMRSRWIAFLSSDAEKPDRNRDAQLAIAIESQAELLADWESRLERAVWNAGQSDGR